ncbi:hypothetical protein NDU88_004053 [Pleurodeles waltl]|uniref:Uncharacterized protein n=1 Tax=Pleurodeles waltl TaxID=8319 RepID=A0AAV7V0A4_PLEWA|nr:hypothetical protein NDU88_004053 [Pleurodeles waltl]
MYVPDLDGPGVEAAETPFDINERVTVLQELQQFPDDNDSAGAASTGIKDVSVMPTGCIPKIGDLVREKVAVKKEFGPFYRPLVPVLGIHGTRTVILPPLALILTLAGGGGRPPKSRRQITVPRSKDRGGNSDFPAGLAGGRLQTARQPSGKEASTMKPARNRAGGVEAVRRVQLHPSRISLSAQQTVKYM